MKLAWLTDIHLNFLDEDSRNNFYQDIINLSCDALVITGDIAEAPSLSKLLIEMAEAIKKPIYFILGNHDYYRGDVTTVRKAMADLTQVNDGLFWLPASGIQILPNHTILVGRDGWADGRMIQDLFKAKIYGNFVLLDKMQELADADAVQLLQDINQAAQLNPKKIIVLTHVPPFREACQHLGEISGDDWLPYFASKAMGDVLMKAADDYKDIKFLALCGHTHSDAVFVPVGNLTVRAGAAEYGRPGVQEVLVV